MRLEPYLADAARSPAPPLVLVFLGARLITNKDAASSPASGMPLEPQGATATLEADWNAKFARHEHKHTEDAGALKSIIACWLG